MKKETLKFKSKIDWLVPLVYVTLILVSILIWVLPGSNSLLINIVITVFLFIILALFTWSVSSSYYLLTDEFVIAVSGLFKIRIAYNKIQEVKPNKSAWSSLSLSFDRVLIKCGRGYFNNYYFSPKDKKVFIKELESRIAETQKKNKNKNIIY